MTTVEADRHLLPALDEVLAGHDVRVVGADVREVDWDELLAGAEEWSLVANLPYNLATPIVLDVLAEVEPVRHLLVMVQREVGERLAAPAGSRTYGIPSVLVALRARAEVVGRVSPEVFLPRPRVESALVRIERRDEPATRADPEVLTGLVRTGLRQPAQDAAPLPRRAGRRGPVRGRRRRPTGPARTARHRGLGSPGRGGDVSTTVAAPAKLTLSLRVVGVRADGLHLIDAEMLTIDLADRLTFGEGLGVTYVGPEAAGVDVGDDLVTRALAAVGRTAAVRVDKQIPHGAGLGGGSADAAAVLRWAGCADLEVATGLGADVPFCVVGGRARVGGIGDVVEPLPPVERTFTLLSPRVHCPTAAVYAAWDDLGGPEGPNGNDLEPAALAVRPELARGRDELAEVSGAVPQLAGSGSTWFVEGDFPGSGRRVVRAGP